MTAILGHVFEKFLDEEDFNAHQAIIKVSEWVGVTKNAPSFLHQKTMSMICKLRSPLSPINAYYPLFFIGLIVPCRKIVDV